MRCIVLNASMEFIHLTDTWYQAVNLLTRGKVTPLYNYEETARSEKQSFLIPAVVALRNYVNVGRRRQLFTAPTKRNILIRDNFTCAYCSKPLGMSSCHRDHVQPLSRGGKDVIENVVSSCGPCNWIKADRTPSEAGMKLYITPRPLTDEERVSVLVKTSKDYERKAWLACLKKHKLSLF